MRAIVAGQRWPSRLVATAEENRLNIWQRACRVTALRVDEFDALGCALELDALQVQRNDQPYSGGAAERGQPSELLNGRVVDEVPGHERDYADAEPKQSHHFPFKPPYALLQQGAFVVHISPPV